MRTEPSVPSQRSQGEEVKKNMFGVKTSPPSFITNVPPQSQQEEDYLPHKTNRDAMPPPEVAPSPGPSDWMSSGGPVCDGDYITLRNDAWGGSVVSHSWEAMTRSAQGNEVTGVLWKNQGSKTGKPAPLNVTRMDNRYSWCIRRMVFNDEKKAWVLPKWDGWKDRTPIKISDQVVFLCPNDPEFVMGTRNPPNSYGNNGDYKVELIKFPLATRDDLELSSVAGNLRRIVSFGFWHSSKGNVDFLNQSRCLWTFHTFGVANPNGLLMSGNAVNVRNLWTDIKSEATRMWDFPVDMIGGAHVGLIAGIINRKWSGGRNLTQAAGKNGKVIKLALHNNDTDDKAGWIIDAWHGSRYPVQRALIPTVPPPPNPDHAPGVPPPDLEEMIQEQQNPPQRPGMTYDPRTGTYIHTKLENDTQNQNPDDWLDTLAKSIYGKKWNHLTWKEQFSIIGGIGFGGFAVFSKITK